MAGQNQQTTCGELTTPEKEWTTLSVPANFRAKDQLTRCISLEPLRLGRSTIAQEQAALTVVYRRYVGRFQLSRETTDAIDHIFKQRFLSTSKACASNTRDTDVRCA